MTHCHRHLPLPGRKTQDGSGHCPQPQGWWPQKPWSYGIVACNQRYDQRPWLTGGRTGTFTFEPLIMGYVGFVSFNSLIHLLRSQVASILGYLGVQNMSYLFMDSVQGNLILEGLKLYVCQLGLPIITQVAHRGTYPYQKVNSSLLRLLPEILGSPRIETVNPVEHIRGVSCQRRHYQGHEV